MRRICTLRYSRIPSLPILGYLFLYLQLILIRLNIINYFYLSSKDKNKLPTIILELEKYFNEFTCKTFKIGHPLVLFTKPIILEVDSLQLKQNLSEEKSYQNVLWTLVKTEQLAFVTKKVLQKSHLKKLTSLYESK